MRGFRKNIGIGVSIFLLLTGSFCSRQPHQDSTTVLSKAQMIPVLADIYTQEEKVNRMALNPDSAAKVFSYFKSKIFEKSQVSDSVFKASMNYYMEHPKEMEDLYSTLIDTLQLREQRAPSPLSK